MARRQSVRNLAGTIGWTLILAINLGPAAPAPAFGRAPDAGTIKKVTDKDAKAFADPAGLVPKLILCTPSALFDNIDGPSVPVDAFSIYYWLKDDGRAIVANGGTEWLRVGDTPTHPVGWLKNENVIAWKTRALLYPLPPIDKEIQFKIIFGPDKNVARFNGGGSDRLQIAPILKAPADKVNPLYDVAVFNGPTSTGTGPTNAPAPKAGEGKIDIANLKVEVVFVIDTTMSMTPLIEGTKDVVRKIVDYLGQNPSLKGIARFGLVEYQDATPSLVPSRLDSPLTDDASVFLSKLESLRAATIGSEETAEDVLAGLLKALDKEVGWTESSNKHIVLLGDASALLSGPKNTTKKTYQEIQTLAQPGTSNAGEVKRLLSSIYFHAIRAVNPSDPDDTVKCQEQFRELATNRKQVPGFYADLDTNDQAAVRKVANDLIDMILKNIAFAKKVKDVGTAVIAREDAKAAGPMAQSLYMAVKADGSPVDLQVGTVLAGTGRDSENGRQVAIQKILIRKGEIKQLASTLDFLCHQFEDLVEPEKRKDVSEVLDVMQKAAAGAISGEKIKVSDTTKLSKVLGDLPFTSDALQIDATTIALMTRDAYKSWLQKLMAARNDAAQLLEKGPWSLLSMGKAQTEERFTFVRPEELP